MYDPFDKDKRKSGTKKMVHIDWRAKIHILALILFLYFMMIFPHESTIEVSTTTSDNSQAPYTVISASNDPWHGFVVADGVRTEYEGNGRMDITVRGLEYAEFYHSDDRDYDLCVSVYQVDWFWKEPPEYHDDLDCSWWPSMDPARVEGPLRAHTNMIAVFIGFGWACFIYTWYGIRFY